jgi:pimeloyl-ACP methyl ester carboxylesterase
LAPGRLAHPRELRRRWRHARIAASLLCMSVRYAAARRPELVRSLVVIEPPAFAVAHGNPAVEQEFEILKQAYEPERPLTTEQFLVRFMRAVGQDLPETLALPPEDRKGIEAMRAEPAPWELEIPLATLAVTSCPRLVVSGDWHPAFEAVADVLTHQLRAERIVCGGMGHYILDAGERFNQHLEAFLHAAASRHAGG